ncbi:MAG: shikimate dehydrogenase [Lachnospiraceae bacterium]|nr:shikimate dehydrogenase [Lachnospiraceae bacterium]
MDYGLIGYPLGHSFSKEIHESLTDYTYDIHEIEEKDLEAFMTGKEFKAINVTIPYKQKVIPYLSELDDNAKLIGACNTIVNKDGKLIGHNTDFSGFEYMIEKHGCDVSGKKCVVLGDGGASKAVVAVLRKHNASEVIIVDIRKTETSITYEECFEKHTDAEVIVNCSPVGMYPKVDNSPVDLTRFPKCTAVFDVIYNPLETRLTAQAKELGMVGVTGLEMLVAQAVYAVQFFLDTEIPKEKIDEVYKKIYAEKVNQ